MKKFILFSILNLCCITHHVLARIDPQDKPFGPNVYIFEDTMDPNTINSTIRQIYDKQRFNEFGDDRYALLFMPGQYGRNTNIDVRVGYYTHVLGLGETPDDVMLTGAVRTQDAPPGNPQAPDGGPGALTNFWRSCENLAITPTLGSIGYPGAVPRDHNVWAVSQAAPMRRVHIVNGSLRLFELGWSSGGLLANSKVDKEIISGSQQQWLTRNSSVGRWVGGNWNMVFTGSTGGLPSGTWPTAPYTIIDKTPVISEKPYLYYDEHLNEFAVRLGTFAKETSGPDWSVKGTAIPIHNFYLAKPGVTAAELNAALLDNKHLFFTPGVYHLEDTIKVTKPYTVLYGIGLPSLVSDTGKPTLLISDVDGVQVAGLVFDAGPASSPTLLQVGETVSNRSYTYRPIFLYDVFCRVGGMRHLSQCTTCVTINSNDVIGDNFWLWRADHGSNVGWNINKGDTGLIVNGNNVSIHSLMVEHFQKYQTIWNGQNGKVYFYQSEIPYDPPSQQAWKNGSVDGYASYKIGNQVTSHEAHGVGVYCYFRDADVFAETAIEAPNNPNISLYHLVNYWLDGRSNSGIRHIVNQTGGAVSIGNRKSTLTRWP